MEEHNELQQLDRYHDAADKLADIIAEITGKDVGEHTNLNCPWDAAIGFGNDYLHDKINGRADTSQNEGSEALEALKILNYAQSRLVSIYEQEFMDDGRDVMDGHSFYEILRQALRNNA